MDDLAQRIAELARDRHSGASEILPRVIALLRQSMSRPAAERLRIAGAICRAQPAMASIWNAALAATGERRHARFERFVHRVERAPAALKRFATQLFTEADGPHDRPTRGPVSLVTVSSSGSVRHVIEALATTMRVRVACAEGRPGLEGRRISTGLARSGVAVTFFSDAAIAEALQGADAVVLGADAVAPRWFVNKVGTGMLAASAALVGVPVYVVASRDKFCAPALAPLIGAPDGSPDEIWDSPPSGVTVRNPYFERVSSELVLGVITDGGIMPASDVAEFCASLASADDAELLKELAEVTSIPGTGQTRQHPGENTNG